LYKKVEKEPRLYKEKDGMMRKGGIMERGENVRARPVAAPMAMAAAPSPKPVPS